MKGWNFPLRVERKVSGETSDRETGDCWVCRSCGIHQELTWRLPMLSTTAGKLATVGNRDCLSVSLFVCVRSFPCPCLFLWLSFFFPLFRFLRQESHSGAQTCLKISAELLCQPQSTGITDVGYCTWLLPLSPTVWMFLVGCHRHQFGWVRDSTRDLFAKGISPPTAFAIIGT